MLRLVTLAIVLSGAAAGGQPHSPTIALELAHLSDDGYRRIDGLSLEKTVLVRLVQEGFAVLGRGAHPDVLVDLTDGADGVHIEARREGTRLERTVPWANATVAELQLELSQKIVDIVRSLPEPPPEPQALPPVDPPPVAPPLVPALPEPVPAPPAWTVGALAGRSWLARIGGTDAVDFVELQGVWPGFEAGLSAAFLTGGGGGVSVSDTFLEGGASLWGALGDRVTWVAGARIGVLLHDWSDPGATPGSGSAFEPVLAVPLELRWRVWSGAHLALRAGARLATRGRSHEVASEPVWARGALGAELGLGAGWIVP